MTWCTIESDPAVFTELIASFGARDIEVSELYDLENLPDGEGVLGLVFLFKWQPEEARATRRSQELFNEHVFFAKQVVQNACASQAILAVLLNTEDKEIEIGQELCNLKTFAKDLPYDLRGVALANSDVIREAHNSFARPEPFEFDHKPETEEKGDAFHFISYVPVQGKIYELDGLQEGPIPLTECSDTNSWTQEVKPFIMERIQRYQGSEIRFNLLAIHKDKRKIIRENISSLEGKVQTIHSKLAKLKGEPYSVHEKELMHLPDDIDSLNSMLMQIQSEIADQQSALSHEEHKHERYRIENERRRFNYVPFVFALLKKLAEKDKLEELAKKSADKFSERFKSKQNSV